MAVDRQCLHIASKRVSENDPAWIIAEIGINHEGAVDVCARMIEEAAQAGVDAVKLQTIDADENYAPGTESHTLFSQAALSREDTAAMFSLARRLGLQVFTTVGDFETLHWVETLAPDAYKVSSGLLTSLPLIREAAKMGHPVLMSTGMANVDDIDAAMEAARNGGAQEIGLFQCTSIYPAPLDTLNLRSIAWLRHTYGVPTGFSDHSTSIEAPSWAVAAGAVMIEKHLSLDPKRPGFDHPVSLTPGGFAKMVQEVRRVESALGVAGKPRGETETGNANRYHRTLAARRDLEAGTTLQAEDIGIMRLQPGHGGLAPASYDELIGRTLKVALKRYDPICRGDFE